MGGHDGNGGSGSARRRRERRLRQHWRHEQLTLRNAPGHVPAPRRPTGTDDGQERRGGARDELHGQAPDDAPPQAAGAQYFTMDDDDEAPAATRPAPLVEVQPQAGLGRHGGIGFELVLSFAVPQGGLGGGDGPARLPEGGEGEGGGEGAGEEEGQDQEGDSPGNS